MTVEIPDGISRRAKKKTAEEGISLRQFVTEAIEARLQNEPERDLKPWMRHFGTLKRPSKETRRVKMRPE